MKIPQVSRDVWKALYEAAVQFQALNPWDLLSENEVFGVKDPTTGEIGYCSVLGGNREFFALCMYRGSAGFAFFEKMQNGDIDPELDDVFAMQDALMAEFTYRKFLEKEDLGVIKALGFKAAKLPDSPPYPCFRDHSPGYAPWFVTEEQARWLTFALRCAVDLIETLDEDEDFLDFENPDEILTYFPRETEEGELSWTKNLLVPGSPPDEPFRDAPLDELALRKVQQLDLRRDSAWEADAFFVAGGVILDRDRPYYSRAAMIAHRQSGYIFKVDALTPEQDPNLSLRQSLLQAIEKSGFLPVELYVRDERTWEMLKPLADKLDIRLRLSRRLPAILEAKLALNEQAMMGFPSDSPLR